MSLESKLLKYDDSARFGVLMLRTIQGPLHPNDMLGCEVFVWDSLGAPNSMDKTLESFVRSKDLGGWVE